MKYILLVFSVLLFNSSFSQITNTIVNKENFQNSGFLFKGSRVLQVENISTPTEENYFVFSKNDRNNEQDELYIQQFKKIKGDWVVVAEDIVVEPGIITSVWNARKAFFDADKDGAADVLFVYSKHPKENIDVQNGVVLLLIYKNKFYRMENYAETNYDSMYDLYDFNPEDLPVVVFEKFKNFWQNLDKE